ncbi:hypothetical protein GQ54DRAFT_298276, partial [Martensiomyces pterosporus]
GSSTLGHRQQRFRWQQAQCWWLQHTRTASAHRLEQQRAAAHHPALPLVCLECGVVHV